MLKIFPKFIFSNTDLNHIQSHETLKNEREVYFMEVIFLPLQLGKKYYLKLSKISQLIRFIAPYLSKNIRNSLWSDHPYSTRHCFTLFSTSTYKIRAEVV